MRSLWRYEIRNVLVEMFAVKEMTYQTVRAVFDKVNILRVYVE